MNHLSKTLAITALVILPTQVFAQADAGRKARGDFGGTFWSAHSAARSVRHARDYVASSQQYVKSTPKPSPAYLRAESADLAKNLEAAKAEMAYLKKSVANDKAASEAIASIQKHLAAADEQYKKFHACCESEEVNVKEAMECCSALMDHLSMAHDELEALAKKLAPKPATTPKK